jgi:ATP-binding cassette subfamily C protein CydC
VLVLDEPTAGVDPAASDALLRDLLGAVQDDQAVVLISHVAPPEDLVDRVVRIEDGRLLEEVGPGMSTFTGETPPQAEPSGHETG